MGPGDLVMFAWPHTKNAALDWEYSRIGIVVEILMRRPDDEVGDELLIIYEGERWSVPSAWCRPVRERA
jgi:hypothetical protein